MPCTINISQLYNDYYHNRDSKVTLKIVLSLTDNSRGIINNPRGTIYIHLWSLKYKHYLQWLADNDHMFIGTGHS